MRKIYFLSIIFIGGLSACNNNSSNKKKQNSNINNNNDNNMPKIKVKGTFDDPSLSLLVDTVSDYLNVSISSLLVTVDDANGIFLMV